MSGKAKITTLPMMERKLDMFGPPAEK